jgi:uncharacterized phage protein (TIGR01671 family)
MTNQGPYKIPDTKQKDLGINRFIIQQFTGLFDKNNKEIYEGDIIKYCFKPDDHGEPEIGTGEVYYDEKSACFLFDRAYEYDFMIHNLHCEIVGNIFENFELIKSDNQ